MVTSADGDPTENPLQASQVAVAGGGEVCSLQRARRDRERAWTGAAVALAVALLGSVAWLSAVGAPAAAVRALPPPARAQVVQRAVANLRDACRSSDRPRAFCLDQARLALDQPECDGACRAVALEVLAGSSAVR